MEKDKQGFVYLLQINDEKGNKVYKFGKSNDIEQRMKNYKFKKILFTLISDDYSKLEVDLLLLIKNKYKIVSGREYFECDDEKELIKYILQYALNIDNIDNKIYSVINEYKLIEYKKNIETELNDKIIYLEKINNDKYNLIIELNEKKNELEKKNLDIIKDYNIKYEELNNIIKDYDIKYQELNNKIKYLEEINNYKHNLIIELNETKNKLEKKNLDIIKDYGIKYEELNNIIKDNENKKDKLKKIIKDYGIKYDELNNIIKDYEIKNMNFNNDTEDDEKDYSNNISQKNNDTKNMCIYCNKKFTRGGSLRRHIDLDRCSKNNNKYNLNSQYLEEELKNVENKYENYNESIKTQKTVKDLMINIYDKNKEKTFEIYNDIINNDNDSVKIIDGY